MQHRTISRLAIVAGLLATAGAAAQELSRPDSHAPIGVMGDHFHEKGEFMFSYRYMNMDMRENAIGSSDILPDTIVTTIPNRFFGMSGQPPTLRVVPLRMSMEMHMLGLMYAPSDRVTIMAMTSEITKEMDHVTYMGGAGTTILGTFRAKASGLGDTSLSALVRLHEGERNRLHVSAGISLPTGSTDKTGIALTPTGFYPVVKLPYPMQLGSGSYDFLPGVTWTSFFSERASFGIQWRAAIRFSDNDEGYHLGDEHRFTAWYSRTFSRHLSGSARLEWFDRAKVDGIDPSIVAPVQTADPARQGATRTDFALGLNFVAAGGHRVAIEYSMPIDQDLDGPQLKTDDQIVLGYQFSF